MVLKLATDVFNLDSTQTKNGTFCLKCWLHFSFNNELTFVLQNLIVVRNTSINNASRYTFSTWSKNWFNWCELFFL